ncbi:MAG: hypothetical protein NT130_04540 [Candidatus Micrarchaeota archaeon]|nr:hypothetical protein [Candidatus Micrarchaeota archaeon]
MPSIRGISNWYESAQIEYFTPFMKLWLCFNSWYKHVFPRIRTDADAIREIKMGGQIKDSFSNLLDSTSEDAKEFKKALSILIQEIRLGPLEDMSGIEICFRESDIAVTYTKRKITSELQSNGIIQLEGEIYVISNTEILFRETIDVIYQVRCHLIHGAFDIEDRRAKRLVKNSYIVLEKILKPVIAGGPE